MNVSPARLCPAALFALLTVAAPAHADPITWSYNWSSNPGNIAAQSGPGHLWILPTSGTTKGIQDVLAAQLQTLGSVPVTNPATFNAPYRLTMTIHDAASGKSGTLTFTGTLGGWFSSGGASITNRFNSPLNQQLTLGKDNYSVTIGAFASPGTPNSGVFGRIGADVIVTGPGGTATAPEPGSLALAALGAAGLAARRWWQKRRAAVALTDQPLAS